MPGIEPKIQPTLWLYRIQYFQDRKYFAEWLDIVGEPASAISQMFVASVRIGKKQIVDYGMVSYGWLRETLKSGGVVLPVEGDIERAFVKVEVAGSIIYKDMAIESVYSIPIESSAGKMVLLRESIGIAANRQKSEVYLEYRRFGTRMFFCFGESVADCKYKLGDYTGRDNCPYPYPVWLGSVSDIPFSEWEEETGVSEGQLQYMLSI